MSKPWPPVSLGDVLARSNETVEIVPSERYMEVTVRLWGKGVVPRGEAQGQEIAAARRFRVRSGQFVLSRIDARNGALGIVPDSLDGAVASNDFPSYNVNQSKLLAAYLGWVSKTAKFVDLCRAASEGTTNRVRLQEERFLQMSIPLPPLPEQQRIVAKIEELAARIEEARGLRRRARLDEEAFLPSVENVLYGGIEANRWPIRDLESICSVFVDCDHRTPAYVDDGVPLLRPRDVRQGSLDVDGAVRIDRIEYERRCQRHTPSARDIVYSRELSFGNAGFVPENTEVALGQGTMLMRACKKSVLDLYLLRILNSTVLRQQAVRAAKGAAHPHVNLKDIRQFCVPVPPLPEQRRIITHLNDLQAKVDPLKALQAQSATDLDALLPSILDKAFKGELCR